MTQGIHPLAASMINQLNRVDTISNNLANVNTTGFKQDNLAEGTFNHYLEKQDNKRNKIDTLDEKLSAVMNTIPKIDTKYLDSKIGAIIPTGNNLDFALAKDDLFFKVKDKNNNILYTRDGSFKSLDGKLVTSNGDQVLDAQNNPISIDADNEFSKKISIVTTSFKNLDKTGNNNYKVIDDKQLANVENNSEVLLQATLERSNVNSIKSMVGLIEAQRSFEQAQKAVAGIDELNKKVIADVGTVR
jgi:flagellar basal-body rod protein FlgG